MGLYGNILVVPAEPDYWPPANRELLLTLDDIFIEDGKVSPFSPSETTFVAMGRFGNVMLISGEPDLSLEAKRDEVVRFYFTEHREHPGLQCRLAGGADEAGRRATAATTSRRSLSRRCCWLRRSAW